MTKAKLNTQLQRLVNRYGLEEVRQEIQNVAPAGSKTRPHRQERSARNAGTQARDKPRKPRPTATEYVAKMDLPSERKVATLELARRFEEKSFLPTCADIRDFCQIYGIQELASKSRVGAIPRLFQHIAAMPTCEIQRLLNENAFSGPARLGPLADAVRTYGRAARHASVESALPPKT